MRYLGTQIQVSKKVKDKLSKLQNKSKMVERIVSDYVDKKIVPPKAKGGGEIMSLTISLSLIKKIKNTFPGKAKDYIRNVIEDWGSKDER